MGLSHKDNRENSSLARHRMDLGKKKVQISGKGCIACVARSRELLGWVIGMQGFAVLVCYYILYKFF